VLTRAHHLGDVACPEKSGLIVARVQKTFSRVLEPSRTTRSQGTTFVQ
jgi:hypothetical protein